MRDSFIDVSEMPDNDKPRYTKKDLWKVLEEKNELKLKVYELEEELEQLKRCAHACICGSVTDKTRIKSISCRLLYAGSNLLLTTYVLTLLLLPYTLCCVWVSCIDRVLPVAWRVVHVSSSVCVWARVVHYWLQKHAIVCTLMV